MLEILIIAIAIVLGFALYYAIAYYVRKNKIEKACL